MLWFGELTHTSPRLLLDSIPLLTCDVYIQGLLALYASMDCLIGQSDDGLQVCLLNAVSHGLLP